MKRQLGPILAVLALFCAPAAWSQSGSTDSSQSGSTDSSQSSSTQDNSGSSSSQGDSGQDSSSNPSPSPPTTPPPGTFTQYGYDSGQSGSGDSSQPSSAGPQPVFTHPEQLPALSSLTEVTANTGLQLTLAAGGSADSNASGLPTTNWLALGLLQGTLGITQARPHFYWTFNYGGSTLRELGGGNAYNSLTQIGSGSFLWQIAPRWQFTMRDNYYYTDDPFEPFLTVSSIPTFNNPNPTIYIPQATSSGNTAAADLTYQLTAHDILDFDGNENFLRYQQSQLQALQNSYMWAGAGFYQHIISPRMSVGGGYQFTALDFGHGQSRAGVTTYEGFISYQLTPSISISGWGGPEHTNTKDIVPIFCIFGGGCLFTTTHESSWNLAEGANFNWGGKRDLLQAKFAHRVTNGGGLLGAVRLYYASLDYRRTINRRWLFNFNSLYGNNLSISHFRADQYLNSLIGQVGLTRTINQSWTANAYFAVIEQRQRNVPGYTTPRWTDNRIAATLQYAWGHSLGR
ncbi:MAG: hypothetical protein WA655_00430 [Candidatus Korobacteraceae bacterium]